MYLNAAIYFEALLGLRRADANLQTVVIDLRIAAFHHIMKLYNEIFCPHDLTVNCNDFHYRRRHDFFGDFFSDFCSDFFGDFFGDFCSNLLDARHDCFDDRFINNDFVDYNASPVGANITSRTAFQLNFVPTLYRADKFCCSTLIQSPHNFR